MKKIVLSGVEVAVSDGLFIDLPGLQKAADVADIESLRPALWLVQWPGKRVEEAASSRLGVPSVVRVDDFIFAEKEVAKAYVRAVGSHLEAQLVVEISKLKDSQTKCALVTLAPQENAPVATAPFQVDVTPRVIGGIEQLTADARELHSKLKSGKDFSTWFASRCKQQKFFENQDFVFIPQVGEKAKGRPPKDYAITMDMAKRLSMVEETEVGKQAQTYFIEREKMSYELQAKQSVPASDDRISEVLGAVSSLTNTVAALVGALMPLIGSAKVDPIIVDSKGVAVTPPGGIVEYPGVRATMPVSPIVKKIEAPKKVVSSAVEHTMTVRDLLDHFGVEGLGYRSFYTQAVGAGLVKSEGRGYVLTEIGRGFGVDIGEKSPRVEFYKSKFTKVLAILRDENPTKNIQWHSSGQADLGLAA
jgi:phage anti-repressor protein